MTKDQKVIRGKVGVLELAKQLGNVSQACKIMNRAGFSWRLHFLREWGHHDEADITQVRP